MTDRTPKFTMRWDSRDWGSPPEIEPEVFATRIAYRDQTWKIHASLRAANGAMSHHYGRRELWQLREGKWILIREES